MWERTGLRTLRHVRWHADESAAEEIAKPDPRPDFETFRAFP